MDGPIVCIIFFENFEKLFSKWKPYIWPTLNLKGEIKNVTKTGWPKLST